MKNIRFELLQMLLCTFVFTILFSFNVKAEGLGDILQLPDFNSGKAVWIIRTGIGFNGVSGSNKETTELEWANGSWDGGFKRTNGYDITFGFNKSFRNRSLYWGMELGMSSRGYKTSSSWEKSGTSSISGGSDYHGKFQDVTLYCHSVRFSPFTFGYRYTFLEKMAADIHFGGYASYDFAGNYKNEYTDHIISTSKYGNRNDKKTTSTEIKLKDLEGIRRYDAGFSLGVGYWYGKFNIDFAWQRGFIAMYEGGAEEIKIGKSTHKRGNLFTNNFQLKLGYSF